MTSRLPKRFSLRLLLAAMAVFAVWCAWATYYRSNSVTVRVLVTTLPSADWQAAGIRPTRSPAADYEWVWLSRKAFERLIARAGPLDPVFEDRHTTVRHWPHTAFTIAYSATKPIAFEDPAQGDQPAEFNGTVNGTLSGFLGTRRAGQRDEFRVELRGWHEQPDASQPVVDYDHPYVQWTGQLAFEGAVESEVLLFAAPIGDGTYHLVWFEFPGEAGEDNGS